jgi:peptidyl-prolyl cis-trans isomerase A (cyclophilin A)
MFKKVLVTLTLALLCASPVLGKDAPAAGKNPTVEIETTLGNITVELFAKEAPLSVKNFLDYTEKGYYSGTVFHRVIAGFMIQGGGLTAEMVPKQPSAPIKNEAANGLKNDRGTLSMARTGDPDSASSQFFINLVDNNGLNRPNPDGHGYAVFGKVVKGMDVVDKIAATKTGIKKGFRDAPETPVVIKSVKVLK